jgi:peroxiredoxin
VTCNREAASVEAAAQRWSDEVTVVGVAWHGSEGEFESFIDEHGLTFPQLSDAQAVVYDRFAVPVQPALVVIDATGDVRTIHGSVDDELLDQVFEEAAT